MKNFCYCVGGTGSRVAEVAAHLCAANLVGKQDITFIIVDKDTDCGGTKQAREVIESVAALAAVNVDANVGLKRSTLIDEAERKEFCKSNLIVNTWKFSEALKTITDTQYKGGDNGGAASLKQALSEAGNRNDEILFNAFYSKDEQDRDTENGFYGHPSIGALIFKHMIESGGWSDKNKVNESDIAFPVKNYLKNNPQKKARVFLIGSIFGGTGASIFSNLAAHIRNTVDNETSKRIEISGALLLPYFTFAADNANGQQQLIDPTEFYIKSKVALHQYGKDPNLLKTAQNTAGVFDSLYICGQDPLHTTGSKYSTGGPDQKNHFDFVDLAAAKAMTEFFSNGISDDNQGVVYEYRFDPNGQPISYATLSNIPGIANELKALLLFSGVVITRIYGQLRLDADSPGDIFMVRQLYDTELGGGFLAPKKKPNWTPVKETFDIIAARLFSYCKSYVRFLGDIAKNGHDWSNLNTNAKDDDYKFFDSGYIEALKDICEYMDKDNDAARKAINRFITRKDYVPGLEGAISVTDIEEEMRKVFAGKSSVYNRNDVSAELRMGDYVHEVFKYCYAKS